MDVATQLAPIQVRTTIVINMPKNWYHIRAYTEVTSIRRPCPNASKIGQTYLSSDNRGFPGLTCANTSCMADANKDAWVITVAYLLRKIEPIELSVRAYLTLDKPPTGVEAVPVPWKMQAWGMTNSLALITNSWKRCQDKQRHRWYTNQEMNSTAIQHLHKWLNKVKHK